MQHALGHKCIGNIEIALQLSHCITVSSTLSIGVGGNSQMRQTKEIRSHQKQYQQFK